MVKLKYWTLSPTAWSTGNARSNSNGRGPNAGITTFSPVPTEIRMSRNPNYFRAGQPYLDGMVERVIPDTETQVLALENKEVDWIGAVPGPDVDRISKNKALVTAPAPRGSGGGNCITTVIFGSTRSITVGE